ncbi:MAG: hypothetical protein LBD66_00705 [Holosporales bacterium]|jgi:hypothetical protein|nr:hypothetical protein [Holosporales bacterium]
MRVFIILSSVVALFVLIGGGLAFFVGIPAPTSEVRKILPHEQFYQQE